MTPQEKPKTVKVALTVNQRPLEVEGSPMDRLLDVLRETIGLTGTKEGCGEGECGACTVLLDGEPVLSCLVPLFQCRGREVTTVEAIGLDARARQLLDRFVVQGGTQCGACTPGIVVTAWRRAQASGGQLTRDDIREALAGNLCRCTGYEAILRALQPEGAEP